MHLPDLDWYLDHVVVPSGIERRPVGPVRAWQGWWAAAAHRLRSAVDETPVGAATGLALHQGFVLTRAGPRLRCLGSGGAAAAAPRHVDVVRTRHAVGGR